MENTIATFLFFVGIGLVILLTSGRKPKEVIIGIIGRKKEHGWSEHIKRAQGKIK